MSDTKYVVENEDGMLMMVQGEMLSRNAFFVTIRQTYPDGESDEATVSLACWEEDYADTPVDAVRRLMQNARRSVEKAEEDLKDARDKLQDAWGFLEAFAKEIRPCP